MFSALVLAAVLQAPDSLTLSQALDRARVGRPRTAGAAAIVDQARGARRLGRMIPNPTTQFESDDVAPTHKLTVIQPLGWVPRWGAERAAGNALVAGAEADSIQVIADMGREVRRAFYAALAAEERLRLVTEQAVLADSLVLLAERQVTAGDLSDLERDRVAQEASLARLTVWQTREAMRAASVELGRATAWTGRSPPRAVGTLDEGLTEAVAGAESASGAAAGLSDLPAVRSSVADSVAAAERLRSARFAQIPLPGLMAGREWGYEPLARRNVILGFTFVIPFWSQGREAVAEASGRAAEVAAQTAETRLAMAAELETARIHVSETATRARFARDSMLAEARRIRAGVVRIYDGGQSGIIPVFDALRAEREVARAMVDELLAFQHARADLLALLGRWQ